jgi:prepilin-type processing-associated H-X9-DG protein
MTWIVRRARLLLLTAAVAAPASAQVLPSAPIAFADGHVTIGADVSASIGPVESGTGYFNYTDYDHSTLRLLRIDVTAAARLNDHFTILGDVRTENGDVPTPYGLYVRIRPWAGRNFDIQAGRIPPTFGAFPRRIYAADNSLIGYPLAYQYLTSLRADALPASADELLRMRGRGWRATYSIGNPAGEAGLPLASAFGWDTGVQAHGGTEVIDVTGSVTNGSPSNPLVRDDNSGKQFAGRVAYHPSAGLLIGASVARAPFVARSALASLPGVDPGSAVQRAVGADVEYSRGYYLVRFETVVSDWTLPTLASPLRAIGSYVEGRYKVRPGLYVAARLDHLAFNDITGTSVRMTWDAPVTRFEVGGGYYIQRNLLAKVSFQRDTRAAGRRESHLAAAQLVFWF